MTTGKDRNVSLDVPLAPFPFAPSHSLTQTTLTMSALADELMADLDGLSDAEDDYNDDEPEQGGPSNGLKQKATADDGAMSEDDEEHGVEAEGPAGLVLEGGIKPAEELDAEEVQRMELGGVDDVRTVARLEGSRRMAEILGVRFFVSGSIFSH